MTRPMAPAPHSRRALVPGLAAVATALAVVSCSTLPVAPRASAPHPAQGVSRFSDDDLASRVVVSLASGADPRQVALDYGATLGESDDQSYGTITLVPPVGTDADTLASHLSLDPRVRTSERDAVFETAEARQQSFGFDDGFGSAQAASNQSAIVATGFRNANAVSIGSGVTIAILDTGIDPSHPLFAGRIAGGWDFVDNDADPTDAGTGIAYGHGTHVAGIAALAAPGAQLLIVRVLDATGKGDMRTVAAGIRWAVAHGAKVINLSLGSLNPSEAVSDALEQARQAGAIVVASAGNRGTDVPAEYPARSSEVVAVAADDGLGHAAPFTSYGSFVALEAPGVLVRSAYPGGRWYLWSGTSMSTPFVSATVALLLSLHPTWQQPDVLARLQQTADPIAPATPAMTGKLGAGALDAGAALLPDAPPGAGGPDPVSLPAHR